MPESKNASIVRRMWEEVRLSGPSVMFDYVSPQYVRHASERDYTREEFIEILTERHAAFPDLVSETMDILSDGDRVAYRWRSVGTHQGIYLRIPPTNRVVRAEGITISRIENGLIVEDWATWNKNSVLHSLGILPIPSSWGEG